MKTKLLLLLLFSSVLLKAQSKTDSVKLAIIEYPDSTEMYLDVTRPYLFSNIDSAYLYLVKGLEVAQTNKNTYKSGRVYDNLGIYYGIQSKYDSSLSTTINR